MIIIVKTVALTGLVRTFSLRPSGLETGLDFINLLVANGEQLVSVILINQQQRIELPVEAFDGVPVAAHLNQLAQSWQPILSGPSCPDGDQWPEWATRKDN